MVERGHQRGVGAEPLELVGDRRRRPASPGGPSGRRKPRASSSGGLVAQVGVGRRPASSSDPSPASALRTSSPTTAWASRNGIPCATRHSARSVAAAVRRAAASAMRSVLNVIVRHMPSAPAASGAPCRPRRRAAPCPPAGPVVGERQALERRQERRSGCRSARPALPRTSSGDVGVLLLRHQSTSRWSTRRPARRSRTRSRPR